MSRTTIIILSVVVFITGFSVLDATRKNQVDARDLVIVTCYLQVLDAKTREPLNVSVQYPRPMISDALATRNSVKSAPMLHEYTTTGLHRLTWIDTAESTTSIEISCPGYRSVSVHLSDLQTTTYSESRPQLQPETIELFTE